MSRRRLRPADEPFARHSLRIIRALKTGELDPHGYLIVKVLVDEIEPPGPSAETTFTLSELSRLIGWRKTPESLRQKLHTLRTAEWFDFDELKRGPHASWVFRLKLAAIEGDQDEAQGSFQISTPSDLETNSNSPHREEAATPVVESVSESPEFPNAEPPREEKRREETKQPLSEGKKDHVLGKTTAADVNGVDGDRLVSDAESRKMDAELRKMAQAETRRRHEASENERRFLAECQTLVDAGKATWNDGEVPSVEPDAEPEACRIVS